MLWCVPVDHKRNERFPAMLKKLLEEDLESLRARRSPIAFPAQIQRYTNISVVGGAQNGAANFVCDPLSPCRGIELRHVETV